MREKNISKGFTLIELLVVISIISILSAFLLANFVGVRQRGRDAQRKSDLRQLQSALELYRADQGTYPNPSIAPCPSPFISGSTTYMKKVPCDPLSKSSYSYTAPNSTSYTIVTCLENANDSEKDTSTNAACTSTTNVSYTLTQP